ncbi:MAG: GNAT family N-acetyltransferase [Actinobacteria bacterium]|nr:GNAT family N-acetyltransferase [Actinomycetota bacterium]
MTISEVVGSVRPVLAADLAAVTALLDADPVANCFVSSRVRTAGLDPWRLGGDMLGYFDNAGLQSLVYCGANLVPVATTPASRAAFADRLRPQGRRCSSFVGPAEEVLDLWRLLEPAWGRARDVRAHQPVMVLDAEPRVPIDPQVRLASLADLDLVVPACVAMFTAEVGVSPVTGGASGAYRARISEIVSDGRSFVRIEDDVVVFKAEVGAVSQDVCQVQGVWVDPRYRGRGLSESGMAAVAVLTRARIAPVVSLYVNDYNTAARKAYRAVGFREQGAFATVLF